MTTQLTDPLHLPQFSRALTVHHAALSELTYWRYARGILPAFGRFLVQHPDLIRALAADAEALARQRADETHPS